MIWRAISIAFILAFNGGPLWASNCRLALLLALDVSSSVNEMEDQLQRRGLAAALLAPEVQRAFFATPQTVALSVFEWNGRNNQVILQNWRLIETPKDLFDVSALLARSQRSTDQFPTALGHALGFAATHFRTAPSCAQHTLDVSGDGRNNEGFKPKQAYSAFPFAGIVVNGLAIKTQDSSSSAQTMVPFDIEAYYRDELRHGAGAFVEVADGFEDYERAMTRKLKRELQGLTLASAPVSPAIRTWDAKPAR